MSPFLSQTTLTITNNPLQRFSYTSTFPGLRFSFKVGPANNEGQVSVDGRFLSVPVPSGIHWGVGLGKPWKVMQVPDGFGNASPRPLLAYLICKFHGLQKELRQRLFAQCNQLGPPVCLAVQNFNPATMLKKRHSIFCLEPEGDSPWRKSIYDSLTSGCIPIFFSTNTDALSSWHWPPAMRADMRLVVSEADFMSGETTLESVLNSITPERIAVMQAAIAANAHRLHYALEDYPTGDDAFEVLLKKAYLRAQGVPWNSSELVNL
jgi:hypothetical protein